MIIRVCQWVNLVSHVISNFTIMAIQFSFYLCFPFLPPPSHTHPPIRPFPHLQSPITYPHSLNYTLLFYRKLDNQEEAVKLILNRLPVKEWEIKVYMKQEFYIFLFSCFFAYSFFLKDHLCIVCCLVCTHVQLCAQICFYVF